jgi:hypothetical protein
MIVIERADFTAEVMRVSDFKRAAVEKLGRQLFNREADGFGSLSKAQKDKRFPL